MAKSMTGYGRDDSTKNLISVTTEIKSVNHRYFELNARLPRGYGFLEEKLKKILSAKISRGKVDVFIGLELGDAGESVVTINNSMIEGYLKAFAEISLKHNINNDVSISLLANNSDIFSARKLPLQEETIWEAVAPSIENALENFLAMREREGESLANDISSRLTEIIEKVKFVELKSGATIKSYRDKLEQKIRDLLDNVQINEDRLLTETAIFADKIATDEETVRLSSHIEQFLSLLDSQEGVGRKLDFILQEMNREVNTIGSKASDIEVTRVVIDIKAELEKIREQIQNIE